VVRAAAIAVARGKSFDLEIDVSGPFTILLRKLRDEVLKIFSNLLVAGIRIMSALLPLLASVLQFFLIFFEKFG
jgi:hypothetical protein